jgi:thioredoxin-dependent peroxiredoxin
LVEEGNPAPAFTLMSDSGEQVSLESLRGKPVVLYFYPKDDTPGCTLQACGIRDAWGDFERSGAVVLGVSPDSAESHVQFRDKYDLPFTLLADEDHRVSEAYGTWVEKNYAGKTYMGIERSTFVIDEDGNVSKVMRSVKPDEHADDVLAVLNDCTSKQRVRHDDGRRGRRQDGRSGRVCTSPGIGRASELRKRPV